ncbi:DUF4097 family beta strand repeat-containing protein [Amycolatopsis sp. PS_44_ISF1]|uniref:DUF4097 family beta strand repeat-containing protein n=1 Tax=Amycolatopsis sp. PS_44_ISF1 TaxID=2974917 RepID=UPI0028DEA88C|nr:DUF4097 family beta strand repeat-containing protein [Amycolatopsis sp. PS_44_ISF1]MDT8915233.1 DUF4097 domain-containing protein [Amycolatopsis sp. PS_44_ISF1]
MPEFETPEPIAVTFELGVAGEVRIAASDRADTVVEVRPSDPADESDVKAAHQVRVEYANGGLVVKGPKGRAFDFSRKSRSVEVSVELPSGSRISGEAQLGNFHGTGRLGETRLETSAGTCRFEHTGPLDLRTSAGDLIADRVDGGAEVHTASGRVSLGRVEGPAVVKNSNGRIEVGTVAGDARLRAANGDISVERADAGLQAKTANGNIRVGEVVRGSVAVETAMGDLEIGVAEGTAAWVEANTGFGQLHNELAAAAQPGESDETVEVRAHTSMGRITLHRS